jgi:uncharacterized membrane protein (UPF0127 family)
MNFKSLKCLLISLGFLLLFSACKAETPKVILQNKNGDKIFVSVEVVKTQEARQLGLMYRKSLAKKSGMLFIFENEREHPFTMKNTYIPLDMIFINRSKKIAGIVNNTAPKTKGPYTINAPSLYVLEVNAGFCRDNGIKKGDSVIFKTIEK